MLPNTPIKLFFDVSAAVWLSTHYVIAKERGRVKEKITQNSLLLLLLGAWRCRFLCHNLYISYDVQVKWNLYINCNILLGDRKVSVLLGISFAFMLHVISIYWWYRNDDLLYPLAMLPPKTPPPFWHTIFIILVNGMDLFYVASICDHYIATVCLH